MTFDPFPPQTVSEVVNLQPNRTTASGSCGVTVATLTLAEDLTNLTFTFTLVRLSLFPVS